MSAKSQKMRTIDQTMKRITEGEGTFDDMFEKVRQASSQKEREKLAGDLKKEIKKLQRFRDQLKIWLSDPDVRNKDPLDEARRSIESRMEKFKKCEAEVKTKPFSNEGLLQKDVPSKKGSDLRSTIGWLKSAVSSLSDQNKELSADISKMSQKKKLKSTASAELSEKKRLVERNTWHISVLKHIVKSLRNKDMNCRDVEEVKDDIEDYVANCMNDDFEENEDMYSPLSIDADTQFDDEDDDYDYDYDDDEEEEEEEEETPTHEETKEEAPIQIPAQAPVQTQPHPASKSASPSPNPSSNSRKEVSSPNSSPSPLSSSSPTVGSEKEQKKEPRKEETERDKKTNIGTRNHTKEPSPSPVRKGIDTSSGSLSPKPRSYSPDSKIRQGITPEEVGDKAREKPGRLRITPKTQIQASSEVSIPAGGQRPGAFVTAASQTKHEYTQEEKNSLWFKYSARRSLGMTQEKHAKNAKGGAGFKPVHPISVPDWFPKDWFSISASPVGNFPTEVLFMAFYTQQGALIQLHAARELQTRGWMFSKKKNIWVRPKEDRKNVFIFFDSDNWIFKEQTYDASLEFITI